jgi:CheY-like chemotaxis protein
VSPSAKIEQDENNAALLSGNEHILFVDDEETLTGLAKMMLEPLGYKVTAIQSSKEALAIFQKSPERFDLVITDLTMPYMTGYDLVQKLIMVRPDIPVVLCSGNNETILENKEKEQSIKAVLTKPFNRRVLAETIRNVLNRKSE